MPCLRSWLRALECLSMFCLVLPCSSLAQADEKTVPPPADPLTAVVHAEDAERFARLFTSTNGKPTAEQIQKQYLDLASYGVSVFTPYRIQNAEHLAKAVAENPGSYEHAIHDCLPRLQQYNADLRSIYLAMHGLLPDQQLPQIFVVFGAGNSGGTAAQNAQVLGLEVVCNLSGGTPDGLRTVLRRFFAHETVHTFQNDPAQANTSPLLAQVLIEGGADFIASIVTGSTPEPERASWASQRESALWSQFVKDVAANQPAAAKADPKAAHQAQQRWIGNYKAAPPGWPSEVGYWIGTRIWQCYYEAAPDKHQAIRDVIQWNDPALILRKSGYSGGACAKTAP